MANRNLADDASNPNKTSLHNDDAIVIRDSQTNPNSLKEILYSSFKTLLDALYAPIAKGVTNGDSHDHNGGDGAQINHTTLSNIGTNTHAQVDTHIASGPHVTNGDSHDHIGGDGAYLYFGHTPGGRLTLTSGTPVTSSDVASSTNVYYTPYVHDRIQLWNGSAWQSISFTEKTLALGTVTANLPYDVFGYLDSGALAIEKLAWTNTTTRATGISLQDGRYCKTGDKTRLYLGTFLTISTSATCDTRGNASQAGGKRFLWNMYNRVMRPMDVIDTTDSWSYTTNTWRQANGASGNQVEFVVGLAEDLARAQILCSVAISNNGGSAYVGVGIDSTTAPSGIIQGGFNSSATETIISPVAAHHQLIPAVGYHYFAWLEKGTTGTVTFEGDQAGNGYQSGMTAFVMA